MHPIPTLGPRSVRRPPPYCRPDVSLDHRNGYGIPAIAQFFCVPSTVTQLAALVDHCKSHYIPIRVIGRGTNTLFATNYLPGVTVCLDGPAFTWCTIRGTTVRVGAGLQLASLINISARNKLSGLESLAGIPGTVGGAIACNSGSNGVSIGDHIDNVLAMIEGPRLVRIDRSELCFSYRRIHLPLQSIAVAAKLVLRCDSPASIAERKQAALEWRQKSQPIRDRSLGCTFLNPEPLAAGRLIEECGLKGIQVGGVEISRRHANFLVARRPLKNAADVLQAITQIRAEVGARWGLHLTTEIHLWPEPSSSADPAS